MRFLLVHGTTQSPDGWRLLIDELRAFGHSAVTTDLARFGERMSVTEYGKAVAEELSGLNIDPTHIFNADWIGVDPRGITTLLAVSSSSRIATEGGRHDPRHVQ